MGTALDLSWSELTPDEAQRVAAGINNMLEALGRRPVNITGWWRERIARLR